MTMQLGEEKVSYDGVMLVPQYSRVKSRSDVSLRTRVGKINLEYPIIASNMDTITGMKMIRKMDELGGLGILHRGPDENGLSVEKSIASTFSNWSDNPGRGQLALSVGSLYIKREKTRINAILDCVKKYNMAGDKVVICVDFAHGDSEACVDTVAYVREAGFTGTIIAGSVCTPDACKRLLTAGAHAVRVGIGNGGFCSTRLKTGSGYPQFSAIQECVATGIPIIADGGIRDPGDAAKALAAGAKAVMLGGQFAATDCVPGWNAVFAKANKSWEAHKRWVISSSITQEVPSFSKEIPEMYMTDIESRGMASNAAKVAVGIAEGFEEGISVNIKAKPKGSTEGVIRNIADGIKSAMSYSNALTLKEFRKNAKFIRVAPSVLRENRPHIRE